MNIFVKGNSEYQIHLNKTDRKAMRYTATVLHSASKILNNQELDDISAAIVSFLTEHTPQEDEQKTLPLDKPEDKEAPF